MRRSLFLVLCSQFVFWFGSWFDVRGSLFVVRCSRVRHYVPNVQRCSDEL